MRIFRDIITSRNNALIKDFAALSDKKGRERMGAFIAEGLKLTLEAAAAGLPIKYCIVNEKAKDTILPKIESAFSSSLYDETEVVIVSNAVFDKISTEKAPQGVISVIKYLDFFYKMDIIYKEDFFLGGTERAIALCSVRDPSNLGAIIRSSVAFGVDHIVLSDDCADVYNPKTVRSAMGSLFRVKITVVKDFGSFVRTAQNCGRRVYAAELTDTALSLTDIEMTAEDIVIIGNEGHGIPKEISEVCRGSVYIPISKKTESLNAAVAASVIMWEQSKL